MAWLETKGDVYRIRFRYGGSKQLLALHTSDKKEAAESLAQFEANLRLIERGIIDPPGKDADVGVYIVSGGKLSKRCCSRPGSERHAPGRPTSPGGRRCSTGSTRARPDSGTDAGRARARRGSVRQSAPVRRSVDARALRAHVDPRPGSRPSQPKHLRRWSQPLISSSSVANDSSTAPCHAASSHYPWSALTNSALCPRAELRHRCALRPTNHACGAKWLRFPDQNWLSF